MRKKTNSFTVLIICLQIFLMNLSMAHASTFDDIHELTDHAVVLDHHHHDSYSLHLDHENIETAHIHLTDSFQSIGILLSSNNKAWLKDSEKLNIQSIKSPPEVFLKKILRPPRLNSSIV